MDLFFLEARFPLVKTLTKLDGKIHENPYPMAKSFTSIREEVSTLTDFQRLIEHHGKAGRSLIKGTLNRDLDVESRRNSTDPYTRTHWLCLDFDNFAREDQLEELLGYMGLGDTSYVIQYSSKHKITKDFSAHVFFMLERPLLPEQLKLWLMECNLDHRLLSDQITLTRPATALRWPLDVSLAQNDKIIYIAPPKCVGFKDPVKKRVRLVVKRTNTVDLAPRVESVDPARINEKKNEKLNALRQDKGLKKRTFTMKQFGTEEVLSKPGAAVITGKKTDRGFMYFNLNGGDSWGYYHPLENPEIIFNFKGEPNYLTKELLPDYYRAYKQQQLEEQQSGDDARHFAFLDRRTDRYYRGTFADEKLEIFPTSNKDKVLDFLAQKGMPEPDFIEEWDYVFRPDDDRIFVPEERFVNQYQVPEILREAKTIKAGKFPPTIRKVIESVCGGDKPTVAHLLNWLAAIVQNRQRTQTMWVFHGVPGTGKGVLVHEILGPILGKNYVQVKSMASLDEEFNHYMEHCLLLMIDESKRSQANNEERVMARLKQACTDPVIPIRKMRADPYMANNYMNIIVASNYPDPIRIEAGDRRINVAPYQTSKLNFTGEDIKKLRSELPAFAAILAQLDVDLEKAKTPLENEARRKLMYLTQTSLDAVFTAIREGDLDFFIESLPTDEGLISNASQTLHDQDYQAVLREAERHALAGEPHKLTRDQVRLLAEYTLSDMPKTANRFSAMAKHYGVTFTRMSKAGKKVQAMTVDWKAGDARIDDYIQTQRLKAVK